MTSPIAHTATIVLEKRDEAMMKAAVNALSSLSNLVTLSPSKAFEGDLMISGPKPAQASLSKRLKVAGLQADICVQPSTNRKKKLLICDMDSTLIGQECIDELADFAGVKDKVSQITERAMRGEIDFDGALNERVRLLKDLPLTALDACFKSRITLNTGARILARTMSASGAKTVIVSGGFTYFTSRICALAGFDDHQANTLNSDSNKLLGTVGMPILGREAKLSAMKAHVAPFGSTADAVAIGDGANDLAMIEASGLGIAFYAKPAVAAAAHCAINVTDLTTALYFQGFKESEFVTD